MAWGKGFGFIVRLGFRSFRVVVFQSVHCFLVNCIVLYIVLAETAHAATVTSGSCAAATAQRQVLQFANFG
jgi:hypothetical protein